MTHKYFYTHDIHITSSDILSFFLRVYDPEEIHALVANMAALIIKKRVMEGIDKAKATEDFADTIENCYQRNEDRIHKRGELCLFWWFDRNWVYLNEKPFADIPIEESI